MLLEIDLVEVSMTEMGMVLILKPVKKEKIVPIFIGPLEAYAISIALNGQKRERPIAHDLIKTIATRLDTTVERVIIRDYRSGIYYATIYFTGKTEPARKKMRIDSRPSDAVALALRMNAPIYLQESVYKKTSQNMNEVKDASLTEIQMNENFLQSVEDALDELGLPPSPDSKDDIIQEMLDEYDMMDDQFFDLMDSTQFELEKTEKTTVPSPKNDEISKSREEVLNQMIQVAVSRERYEDAASFRDELLELRESGKKRVREKREARDKKH